MTRRRTPIDDSGRRPMAAGHVLLAMLIAFGLGAVLNADSLRATAESQPFGWRRTVAVALVAPVDGLAGLVRLDRPRAAIDAAIGREDLGATSATGSRPVDDGDGGARDDARAPADDRSDGTETGTTAPTGGPSPTSTPRGSGPGDPLRVRVIGDSLTETMGPALAERADDEVTVVHDFRYSTGLSRPDFFDWPGHLAGVLADEDPDALVVMFGGNDAQDIATADGVRRLGTPEWDAEYQGRVGDLMTQLTADGRTVVWVGLPVMRSGDFDGRVQRLNAIYEAQAAQHERVVYLDTRAMFATPEGGYADFLPDATGQTELVRRSDGIHLSPDGGDRLAASVLDLVADQWDLSGAGSG